MTCEQLTRDAAGLAALRAADPERAAAYAHAAGCPGCASALREGERLLALLDALPAPMLAPAAARRAARELLLATEPPSWLLSGIAAASAVLLAISARSPSGELERWFLFGALTLSAAGVAALARRGPWSVVAALATSTLALAFEAGGEVPALGAAAGLKCLAIELAAAALPVAAALSLGPAHARAPLPLAAAAAAGALGGQAALTVSCHAAGSLIHGLAFHLGGVALAAGLGAAAGLLRRPERA